ncbi:MAG: hypothetical protein LAN84_08285 [Acidobacteriia bacterium]|nr:hypothetical protein [Terriglobia bacterium]
MKRSKIPESTLCQQPFSDGRKCRLPRSATHPRLCLVHAREERQLLEADRIAAELASLSGEFQTASDVNHVLGKLFALLAGNRIPRRNVAILAYIGQLLLHSLPAVKHEISMAQGLSAWEQTLRRAFPVPPSQP